MHGFMLRGLDVVVHQFYGFYRLGETFGEAGTSTGVDVLYRVWFDRLLWFLIIRIGLLGLFFHIITLTKGAFRLWWLYFLILKGRLHWCIYRCRRPIGRRAWRVHHIIFLRARAKTINLILVHRIRVILIIWLFKHLLLLSLVFNLSTYLLVIVMSAVMRTTLIVTLRNRLISGIFWRSDKQAVTSHCFIWRFIATV